MSKIEWQTIKDALGSLWILAMANGDSEIVELAERATEIHNKNEPKGGE
jgi:aminopeptidase-like protein